MDYLSNSIPRFFLHKFNNDNAPENVYNTKLYYFNVISLNLDGEILQFILLKNLIKKKSSCIMSAINSTYKENLVRYKFIKTCIQLV